LISERMMIYSTHKTGGNRRSMSPPARDTVSCFSHETVVSPFFRRAASLNISGIGANGATNFRQREDESVSHWCWKIWVYESNNSTAHPSLRWPSCGSVSCDASRIVGLFCHLPAVLRQRRALIMPQSADEPQTS
jgi:hypothetical protein